MRTNQNDINPFFNLIFTTHDDKTHNDKDISVMGDIMENIVIIIGHFVELASIIFHLKISVDIIHSKINLGECLLKKVISVEAPNDCEKSMTYKLSNAISAIVTNHYWCIKTYYPYRIFVPLQMFGTLFIAHVLLLSPHPPSLVTSVPSNSLGHSLLKPILL